MLGVLGGSMSADLPLEGCFRGTKGRESRSSPCSLAERSPVMTSAFGWPVGLSVLGTTRYYSILRYSTLLVYEVHTLDPDSSN